MKAYFYISILFLGFFSPDLSKVREDYKNAFEEVFSNNELESLINTKLPSGIIHGDLFYDNTLFNNNGLQV